MPTAPLPRSKGGQPGNINALRHGFYRRALLSDHRLALLEDSRSVTAADGVADTIDLLRVEILTTIETGDYRRGELAALAKALMTAELVHLKLTGGDDRRDAMAALDAVLSDVRRAEEERDART